MLLYLDQLYDKINILKYVADESFHLSKETLDELAKNIGKAAFSNPLHRKDLEIFVQKLRADLWQEQMKIYSIEADLRKLKRKQPKDPSFELEGQIKLKAEELYSAKDLLTKNQEMAAFFQTILIESNL